MQLSFFPFGNLENFILCKVLLLGVYTIRIVFAFLVIWTFYHYVIFLFLKSTLSNIGDGVYVLVIILLDVLVFSEVWELWLVPLLILGNSQPLFIQIFLYFILSFSFAILLTCIRTFFLSHRSWMLLFSCFYFLCFYVDNFYWHIFKVTNYFFRFAKPTNESIDGILHLG